MPPCNVVSVKESEDATAPVTKLQLSEIRKAIPEQAFKKSIAKALGYMLFDFAMWFGTVYFMKQLCDSSLYQSLPLYQRLTLSVVYFNVAGFFMWCLFMIGHDCGHGTFSDSDVVNDIFGHFTHGALLVPYFPWQLSHRRHHMYHNHADKDYSYPWYTPDRMDKDDEFLARFLHANPLIMAFFPFYGWQTYFMLGKPDGNHMIPFPEDRLWKNTPLIESYKCIFSALYVIGSVVGIYYLSGCDVATAAYYYFGPWIIFGWWLITVTYLQHHDPKTLVYDDSNWTFVDAAFETVDRRYGYGVDTLTHHITDGHVVHHLFFTKIPHYNLPLATKALTKYLASKNLSHIYRFEKTYDFPYRVHKYFATNGFRSMRASEGLKKEQ